MRSAAIIAAGLAGLVAGGSMTAAAIWQNWGLGAVAVDGWKTDLNIGTNAASPMTRASVAKSGLLALRRDEAVYFFRERDEAGDPFKESCDYVVEGGELPARWWSLTLYAEDDFLPRNEDGAHSVADLDKATDKASWRVDVSSTGERNKDGPWLSNRDAGAFTLLIRLYAPEPAAINAAQDLSLPSIRKMNCEGGRS